MENDLSLVWKISLWVVFVSVELYFTSQILSVMSGMNFIIIFSIGQIVMPGSRYHIIGPLFVINGNIEYTVSESTDIIGFGLIHRNLVLCNKLVSLLQWRRRFLDTTSRCGGLWRWWRSSAQRQGRLQPVFETYPASSMHTNTVTCCHSHHTKRILLLSTPLFLVTALI